jgi:hypothetical protein
MCMDESYIEWFVYHKFHTCRCSRYNNYITRYCSKHWSVQVKWTISQYLVILLILIVSLTQNQIKLSALMLILIWILTLIHILNYPSFWVVCWFFRYFVIFCFNFHYAIFYCAILYSPVDMSKQEGTFLNLNQSYIFFIYLFLFLSYLFSLFTLFLIFPLPVLFLSLPIILI